MGTVPKTFGAVRTRRTAASVSRADQRFSKTADPEIVHGFRNRFVPGLAEQRRRATTVVCADQGFAKAHGWSATILDPGIRVTFRRLKPGQTPTLNR